MASLDLAVALRGGYVVVHQSSLIKYNGCAPQIGHACVCLEELDLTNNELSVVTPYVSLLSGTLRSLLLEVRSVDLSFHTTYPALWDPEVTPS